MSNNKAKTIVSIGICAYNEEANIGHLLRNLLHEQDLAFDFEIIVVCSGCTDRTPSIVKEFCTKDRRVSLIVEPERRGKASAINKILDIYRGDYLFFIPGDVRPEKGSLNELLRGFRDEKVGIIGGRPVPVNDQSTLLGSMVHLIWNLHHHTLSLVNHDGVSTHVSGEFTGMRRGVIKKIPLSIVNDDLYMAIEAKKRGYLVKYRAEARVSIKGPTTITDFIRQRRRIIYGHIQAKTKTGSAPRVLESMAFYDQKRVIQILTAFLKEIPTKPHIFFLAVIIEGLTALLVFLDTILGKTHVLWTMSPTTKEY